MTKKGVYIEYEALKQRKASLEILETANEIIKEYADQGYDLTLRQLYYQFIARDAFPDKWADKESRSKNTEKNYKKLIDLIKNGRLAGLVDWTAIVDRTRRLETLNHYTDPGDFLTKTTGWFNMDLWANQAVHPEVWIEKVALLGILSNYCTDNDVPHFACKGYGSVSELWRAGMRIVKRLNDDEHPRGTAIIYVGDHDPSGLDMDRDIYDRLLMFVSKHVKDAEKYFTVVRAALTLEQVQQYNPPPSPAKESDARYKQYLAATGLEECWELDALEPDVLIDVVKEQVDGMRDDDKWAAAEAEEDAQRELLERAAEKWDELQEYI